MTSLKKYSLFIVIVLLVSACANRARFEWIKINPDKIKEANNRVAYRNGIRNIDLTLDLKEKTIPIYYESPEAFKAENSTPLGFTKPELNLKPIVKSKVVNLNSVIPKRDIIRKPAPKKPVLVAKPMGVKTKKNGISVLPEEEIIALNKLNAAMRIPKKPIKQIIGEQKENTPQIKKEVKKIIPAN